jgi:hypothetical protein
MTALALSDVLKDFGTRTMRAGDCAAVAASPHGAIADGADTHHVGPASMEEAFRAEIERAEGALRERLALEHEAALEFERQRHAAEAAEMLARFGEQTGAAIAEKFAAAEEAVATLATSATARILAIHLSADVQKRMIDALGDTIRHALRDSEAVRVRVRGPLSLYEALRAAMGNLARHLDYTEAPDFDLSVSIDDSLFETRLSEWSAALTQALS